MKFCYNSGQRPLDGYTLKRGIGRGGFGEVYFALSDGGKEVALKLVRGDCAVELRGVAQCLNLKHPNLVALYDLRRDAQGCPWVVMEYVAGEPLNVVLSRHPDGLPRELAREWFLGMARAVGCLHDHGIVHRDLKPGNVFLENGVVKVGDYGLSKSMAASQRTAQTQSVGTVHYMAPEISTGNYNKQIDTYAAGIMLYEMLTGCVPFDGESAGEILMKHLTAPPDLSKLPPEYLPVVAKALAKNPAQRYASMAEMVRAVEAIGTTPAAAEQSRKAPPVKEPTRLEPVMTALPAETPSLRAAELCGALILAAVFAALGTAMWWRLAGLRDQAEVGNLFFLSLATSWAVLTPAKFWTARRGNSWARRLVMLGLGAGVGVLAWWLEGWPTVTTPMSLGADSAADGTAIGVLPVRVLSEAGQLSFYALAFAAMRWWRMTDRRRPQRFSFAPLLGAAFWGFMLLLVFGPSSHRGTGVFVLVLAAAIVQLVSPWDQPPPPAAKRVRLRYA